MRSLLCTLALGLMLSLGQPSSASPGSMSPGVSAGTDVGVGVDVGVWPLAPEPEVVRPFEPPADLYSSGHRGVDLAGHQGQAVRATMAGTVGFVGSIGGKPVVTVLHGARRTTYEPVAAAVERGQEVAAGEALGRLVVTDSHCFPRACLHWGLIEGEVYLDPLTLVGTGPVRLLPLWRAESTLARRPWTPVMQGWRRPLDWLA